MERRRIIINFKNTPEDIALYETLKRHSCISGYIKDVLRGLEKNKDSENVNQKDNSELDKDISNILEGI